MIFKKKSNSGGALFSPITLMDVILRNCSLMLSFFTSLLTHSQTSNSKAKTYKVKVTLCKSYLK